MELFSTKAAYLRTPRVCPSSHCSLAYGSVATLTGQTSVDGAVSRRHYDGGKSFLISKSFPFSNQLPTTLKGRGLGC